MKFRDVYHFALIVIFFVIGALMYIFAWDYHPQHRVFRGQTAEDVRQQRLEESTQKPLPYGPVSD